MSSTSVSVLAHIDNYAEAPHILLARSSDEIEENFDCNCCNKSSTTAVSSAGAPPLWFELTAAKTYSSLGSPCPKIQTKHLLLSWTFCRVVMVLDCIINAIKQIQDGTLGFGLQLLDEKHWKAARTGLGGGEASPKFCPAILGFSILSHQATKLCILRQGNGYHPRAPVPSAKQAIQEQLNRLI